MAMAAKPSTWPGPKLKPELLRCRGRPAVVINLTRLASILPIDGGQRMVVESAGEQVQQQFCWVRQFWLSQCWVHQLDPIGTPSASALRALSGLPRGRGDPLGRPRRLGARPRVALRARLELPQPHHGRGGPRGRTSRTED